MFNTICYYLNFVNPRISATLRMIAWKCFPSQPWRYGRSVAGYSGGTDVRYLGPVAFFKDNGDITFQW